MARKAYNGMNRSLKGKKTYILMQLNENLNKSEKKADK